MEIFVWIGVWFTVLVFTIFIEALTTDLVSIWFGAGSFVALLLAAFDVHYQVQIFVFLIISIVLLFSTRPLLRRWVMRNETKTNIEGAPGQIASVVKDIPFEETGEIKLNGIIWTALATETIKMGEKVEVVAIQGNKMLVKKHNPEEEK